MLILRARPSFEFTIPDFNILGRTDRGRVLDRILYINILKEAAHWLNFSLTKVCIYFTEKHYAYRGRGKVMKHDKRI